MKKITVKSFAFLLAAHFLFCGTSIAQIQVQVNGTVLEVTGTPGADRVFSWNWGNAVFVYALDAAGNNRATVSQGIDELKVDVAAGNDIVIVVGLIESNITGGDGDDLLIGGAGIDFMDGDDGNDRIFARNGDDWPDGGNHQDLIVGGAGGEVMNGNDGNDLLIGLAGNDLMTGGAGQDILFGGDDGDRIEGWAGRDWLFGENGPDDMLGDNGDDILCGGFGPDSLEGNLNDDWLWGEGGPDLMNGGAGNNELFGNPALGDRFIAGRQNPDALCLEIPGPELPEQLRPDVQASVTAGGGQVIASGRSFLVFGTAGADAISIQAENGLTRVGIETRGFPAQSFEFETSSDNKPTLYVEGNHGGDTISVSGKFLDVLVDGGAGDDTIDVRESEAGFFALFGESGDDLMQGSATPGLLAGGDGNDTIISAGPDDLILMGSGRNELKTQEGQPVILDRLPMTRFKLLNRQP